jgi:hypothetical protein
MHDTERVLYYLPRIDSGSLNELLNVIKQSNNFVNHLNDTRPTNEFELAYAKYLGSPHQEFIDIYYDIVLEACFREFLEWYEYITKHILNKDVQKAFGYTLAPEDTNWIKQVENSKLLKPLLMVKTPDHFLTYIKEVSEIGKIMNTFFNKRKPLSTLDSDYFESDHAQLVLTSIDDIIIDGNIDKLVNQIQTDELLCMIEVYGWENRFNPVLLEWIWMNKGRVKQWI